MDDWFSVDVSDPGSDWWNAEPISQTWNDSYDYSYDMPAYDYTNYDFQGPTYDEMGYDAPYQEQGPTYDELGYDAPYQEQGPTYDELGYGQDQGGYYGGGDADAQEGGFYGGGPSQRPMPEYGQPQQPGQTRSMPAPGPQQPGQPQRPGQQQPSLLDRAIGAVTGGGSGGGGGGGSLMDSLFPMLLAGGAGYLLSNLIGSKSGGGAAPGGSIGAFGVNQAALSPTKPLNTPGSIMGASSQPAWGNPGAPSATSLGFNAPGQGALGQLAVGGMPMRSNFQPAMQTQFPQLPAPQMNMPQMTAPQQSMPQMTAPGAPTVFGMAPGVNQGFETNPMQQAQMPTPQPVAPMDINNVNFGAPTVAGYTPPAGAPVAPNQINDYLRSLMG